MQTDDSLLSSEGNINNGVDRSQIKAQVKDILKDDIKKGITLKYFRQFNKTAPTSQQSVHHKSCVLSNRSHSARQ